MILITVRGVITVSRPGYTVPQPIADNIKRILLHEWNPIGLSFIPVDEYDSYINPVYQLLLLGATDGQIVDYLNEVEPVKIGLLPVTLRTSPIASLVRSRSTLAISSTLS